MVIKIPVKKGLSNKTQTKAKNDPTPGATSPPHGPQPASSLIPFIDKLSVVVTPKSLSDAQAIHQAVVTSWGDKKFLQSAKKLGGFNTAHRIVVPQSEHQPVFHYRYAKAAAERLRFEFNPADLGPEGMVRFHGQLKSIMNDGWEYVIANGKITRIDITVDVPSVRMDEFLFIPKQSQSKVSWWKQGRLETMVLGKQQGNQTIIYSKKKEQMSKGELWEGKSTVRIERRLRNPSPWSLAKLPTLGNPWSGTTVAVDFPGPPLKGGDQWTMFGDSVRQRGVDQALALLSKERKARYRKHLKENSITWWDPDAIWANWPKFLQSFPIGDKAFFASE